MPPRAPVLRTTTVMYIRQNRILRIEQHCARNVYGAAKNQERADPPTSASPTVHGGRRRALVPPAGRSPGLWPAAPRPGAGLPPRRASGPRPRRAPTAGRPAGPWPGLSVLGQVGVPPSPPERDVVQPFVADQRSQRLETESCDLPRPPGGSGKMRWRFRASLALHRPSLSPGAFKSRNCSWGRGVPEKPCRWKSGQTCPTVTGAG
ncbi:unnamed protein product [Prorocentrum cordatum]|nr:unnamed protein product [Polarella glacialis]